MTPDCLAIESELAALRAGLKHGAVLLDVREASEWADGVIVGAHCLALSAGTAAMIDWARRQVGPVYVICAQGPRSLRAVKALREAGVAATSVRGGMKQWRIEGGEVVPKSADSSVNARYARHLQLPEVGAAGQARLGRARVAVVGAGGLGSPVAFYLAAAGVGDVRLIDDDLVERSNLQRQILHRDDRIGRHKVTSAAETLSALNPDIRIDAQAARLERSNALELLADCDLVVDGADNFPTRYLVNAVCLERRIPWVYGAVHRFEGQVSVFDPRLPNRAPCYRCLFPEPPSVADAPNCAEAGVLGVLPGVIGTLQASEAIKLLLGIGTPLVGRLLIFDALSMQFRELRYATDPQCPGCGADAGSRIPAIDAPVCSLR